MSKIVGVTVGTALSPDKIRKKVIDDLPTPVISWNDLTDKPFGEMPPAFDIQWDGVIGDKFALDLSPMGFPNTYAVKVSDSVFTVEELDGALLTLSNGYGQNVNSDTIDTSTYAGALNLNWIVIVYDADSFNTALGTPEGYITNGTYFIGVIDENYANRLAAPTTIKKIDNKYLDLDGYAKTEDLEGYAKTEDLEGYAKTEGLSPVATSGSWNDLTDKPFGREFEYVEVASASGVVDAYNTDNLQASFQATLDFAPINGKLYKLVATDGVQTIEVVRQCHILDSPVVGIYMATIGGLDADTASIYLYQNVKGGAWGVAFLATTEVGAEWTITIYEYSEIITPLDDKYLPDGIPFVASASVGQGIAVKAVEGNKPIEFEAVNLVKSYNDLTDAPVGEKITTLIGERTVTMTMFNSATLADYNLTGCSLVCFDGVEYEVPRTANGMEYLYGNPALLSTMFPSNGMPFVLVHNQVSNAVKLYVSELGTHTISAYKRELVFLSEKYLPDSVVLESELEGKGYQTEEQVKTLIDEASGAISWNDLEDRPFGDTFDFTEVVSVTLTVDNYDEAQAQCECSGFLNFTAIHGREYKLEATDGIQTITGRGTCKIIDVPTASIYAVDITSYDRLIGVYTQSKVTSALWNVFFTAKSEVGTEWIIRIYEEVKTIKPLDEKYLPESVVLESELDSKGYQTEKQVTALINNALGVIENGTY